ncbi:MAG: glycosyltransferase family 2 protein [Proteobacteria bacterium]|nr:glycosyltransferase family 2 protein [Desulfocapsa sp.]MBU3946027.1 glycosyltransferase family 2 protein [Pseudomonadota bacterium]MCG2742861.1 glycosyltransferase family 2 protein [Desulfobacteraceae bacterium]MBU4030176.1 glycosyltransferase family 2 protein [Pseudomonadota bacterium]MBU4043800.1 glycosyltransferase family 2 protein [Pseudomonadota bacterium]
MDVSVVVPLLNEEKNIPILYDELTQTLQKTGLNYEILFVDDGSSDCSLEILENLQQFDSRICLISLRKNFGQTAAMSAGFDMANGDIIIAMDADLQNDPADIPMLLAKINEGADMVTGWRYNRQDPFFSRKLPSKIANRIISFATGVHLHDYGCTLKAFRREVIKTIKLYGEMHRFIPAIASAMGVSIAEVKVNHRPRRFGTSKYGISRTLRVILDLITVKFLLNYATRPIHVFGTFGFVSGSLGGLLAIVLTVQRQLYGVPLSDRPLLLLAVLLIFVGVQFVTIGLVAEMLARTYHESQDKPTYYIRKIIRKD